MGKDKGGAGATSNNVYVMDKKFAWVPARLVESNGDKAIVSIPEYESEEKILSDGGKGAVRWKEDKVSLKHYPGKALPMQNVDKSGVLTMVPDMCDLPYLHEVSLSFVACLLAVASGARFKRCVHIHIYYVETSLT